MFDSEPDQVANCALPSEADLLQGSPQCAVEDKLGEHAWFMLDTYLTVADKLPLKILKHTLLRDVLLKPLIR